MSWCCLVTLVVSLTVSQLLFRLVGCRRCRQLLHEIQAQRDKDLKEMRELIDTLRAEACGVDNCEARKPVEHPK